MSTNWYREKDYCTACGKWNLVVHRKCEGKMWINIVTGMSYCETCKKSWPAEDGDFHCNCGHVQKMIYTDSAVVIGVGDQVIATDGDMIYVRRRSGAVVYGKRAIHTVSFDPNGRWQ